MKQLLVLILLFNIHIFALEGEPGSQIEGEVKINQEVTQTAFSQENLNEQLKAAIIREHIELIRALLRRGAKLEDVKINGMSAFRYKFKFIYTDLCQIHDVLLEEGANINETDANGDTLLHFCLTNDSKFCFVEYLIYNGIDIFIRNKGGKTALEIAMAKKKYEYVDFINSYFCWILTNKLDEQNVDYKITGKRFKEALERQREEEAQKAAKIKHEQEEQQRIENNKNKCCTIM